MRDQRATAEAPPGRFLTFRLDGSLYALPSELVLEVIHVPAVARVPHSPAALLGVANLRGTVLPLVGLRALLGARGDSAAAATKAIVLDAGAQLALAVDSVDSLVAVAQDAIETRESELSAREGELLSGAFRSAGHDEVAKILAIERLLGAAFTQQPRRKRQSRAGAAAAHDEGRSATSAPSKMLVTFEVAQQEFALELESVQEILPAPAAVTLVPRAETPVLGVTSLRDRLLPLLSLRGLLGFPPAPASDGREKVVVTNVGGAQVGLVADRARTILSAADSSIDSLPPVLAARTGGEARLKAIYRGDGGRRLVSILSPEQLFREDVMRRLGEGAQNQTTHGAEDSKRRAEQTFLVFRLGQDEFGLPIDAVDEVGEVPAKIARLPKTPKFLEGVVNLRGDVLPVVDQRRRFDMPAAEELERRRLVVVRTERHRAGLIVDG
ncbi:MAG TPA: chemotaxis protein CheW, partial [Gammaproteobacteria bacterium]|nr:chemotaxis protein CheW [Gammaproteobacteria bacterium]